MTDKELLELAAKAAGIHEGWPEPDFGVQWNGKGLWCFGQGQGELWNPLTDDGDALRLAVRLGISIQHSASVDTLEETIETFDSESRFDGWFDEVKGNNPYAATRRAIVRAAAEIGKETP